MANKGLGHPELRSEMATAVLTSAEFDYLVAHPEEVHKYSTEIVAEYNRNVQWKRKSAAANRAVATKREKYAKWPGGRNKKAKP